jgi:TRAP-type C4-dicarboxylate transport system permease small subunit
MLSIMGFVVFLDVCYRVSTRAGSIFANPIFVGIAASIVGVLAWRTRGAPNAVVRGVATGVAVVGAQQGFIRVLPNGLVWSQTLALALLLWLGMIGASLAAYSRRHLALDIGSKLWPASLAHRAAAVGHFVTALFCGGLSALSAYFVATELQGWSESGHAAGNLSGTDIPLWAGTLSIPAGMALLAFRFSLEGARTWLGLVEDTGDDTLHQLGIRSEEAS